ncbi:MAG: hypothetical protein SXQ77_00560, partial [Halobacteria archaeon]|nr:hypothetical protein [Halobacteria archaeon]
YGSLINPDEITSFFACTEPDLVPVRVEGFRRSFAQKSLHREGENGESAIMTVEKSDNNWFNATLFPVTGDEFEGYKIREGGYTIVDVETRNVTPYADYSFSPSDYDRIVTAVGDRPLEDPRPIPYYASMCVEGAKEWGDSFLADFLVTTYRR